MRMLEHKKCAPTKEKPCEARQKVQQKAKKMNEKGKD